MSYPLYESLPEQASNISYNSHNYSKKYEYDPISSQHVNSNLRRVTDSRGDIKTFFYDGLNRLTASKYSGTTTATDFYYFWDGSTSVTVGVDDFNGSSFTKTTSRPSGFTASNSTDRISAIVNDGSTKGEYFEYGSDGQVLKHLERVYDGSSSTDFTTQAAYNNLLMPTSLTYPSNRQVDYSYDAANRLSAITDHGTSETYASGIAYTSAGQIDNFNIGNTSGQRKESYTYNNRLQLSTQKVQVGSSPELLNLTYSYAGASGDHGAGTGAGNTGQLISMTDSQDSTKSVSYTYDLLGRLKTAQTPSSGWSVKETYDRYGNRWQQDRVGNSTAAPTSGSGTVTISGSEQSTTNQVQDYCQLYGDEGCLEWHYSWVTTYDSGQVSVTVGSYTANASYGVGSTSSGIASALASQFNSDPSSTATASVSGSTLTLTAKTLGTVSNYTVSTSADTFDPGDFGSSSFGASGSNLSGGAAGSLGSGGTGPQSNLSFDLNNHINTTGYTYDNGGNLTTDPVYTYTYDGENRQTQVTDGSVTTTYGYNASRERMIRTSGGVSTFYIYGGNGQQLAEQVGASGTWHDYIYLGTRVLADVTSSSTTYHYADRISTRLTTDSGGSVLSRQQTAPFGEVQSDTSSSVTKRKAATYERDGETANDYAINRQYTAANARFTQADPAGTVGVLNPQRLNMYSYALNDAVNLVDPSGLDQFAVAPHWECTTSSKFVQPGYDRSGYWESISTCVLKGGGPGGGGGQTPAGGGGAAKPCPPTGQEIKDKLQEATMLDRVWTDSKPDNPPASPRQAAEALSHNGSAFSHEEGGWVFWNPATGETTVDRAKPGNLKGIDLTVPPGVAPKGSIVIATFHTHPWAGAPAHEGDEQTAFEQGVPGIVVTSSGTEVQGPSRAGSDPSKAKPPSKGFPGNSIDYSGCK